MCLKVSVVVMGGLHLNWFSVTLTISMSPFMEQSPLQTRAHAPIRIIIEFYMQYLEIFTTA